jgi:hypothetical protein
VNEVRSPSLYTDLDAELDFNRYVPAGQISTLSEITLRSGENGRKDWAKCNLTPFPVPPGAATGAMAPTCANSARRRHWALGPVVKLPPSARRAGRAASGACYRRAGP